MNAGVISISSDCDYGPKEIIKNNINGVILRTMIQMIYQIKFTI